MTPAEEAYAAAWLAEMWRPVREHHQNDADRAASWARNAQVGPQAGDDTPEFAEKRAS